MSILSIRLDRDLEDQIEAAVRRTGQRRSELVRQVLREALPSFGQERSAAERYERVKHVIGAVRSGFTDLGRNHEEHLRRIFDAKRDDIMGRGTDDRADRPG